MPAPPASVEPVAVTVRALLNQVSDPPLTEGAVGEITSTRQVAVRTTVRVPRTRTVNVCRPGLTDRYEIDLRHFRQRLRSSLQEVLVVFPVRFQANAAVVARVTAAGLAVILTLVAVAASATPDPSATAPASAASAGGRTRGEKARRRGERRSVGKGYLGGSLNADSNSHLER
jgi:hypothetical protein